MSSTVSVSVIFLLVSTMLITSDVSQGTSVQNELILTATENATLNQFRTKVSSLLYLNFMKHDLYLLRWLRAQDFNVPAAENMLRTHLKWRKEQKIDTIITEDWNDMLNDYPVTLDSVNKNGQPDGTQYWGTKEPKIGPRLITDGAVVVLCVDIWTWDLRSAVLQGLGQRWVRYLTYLQERLRMQVFQQLAKGFNATKYTVIGNADGFNIIQHGCPSCMSLWMQFVQMLEANYVGWWDEVIIIESPSAVKMVISAIQPFMSKQTRESLKVFALHRNQWEPYLDERINKDQLRPQYGGTRKSSPRQA